ncbi:MAG TPA: alanine racemase [Terriglobales bacterium]|nr:alanine racemase [Terriglobales bacterium]
MESRPTWAEVSLPALRHNYRVVRDLVAPATICAVLKADAYGHGAVECAEALEAEGATWFGVTSTGEGVELRQAGVKARILLMTGFWQGEEEDVLRYQLTPAVWEPIHLELLDCAARRLGPTGKPVPVHLKVDTGMTRLGIAWEGSEGIVELLKSLPRLTLEGVATHLASSEVMDAADVELQSRRFDQVLEALANRGCSPKFVHMANSAALALRPASWKTMVRPGLCLYGYFLKFRNTEGKATDAPPPFSPEPVLSWKTRILTLRDVLAGQAVGYGGTYVTPGPSRIAVLPVGYADGLNRQLSNRGRVVVRGQYARIVGNISMDITLIDVTPIPGATVGDEVVLLGRNGGLAVSPHEHAAIAATVPYEILCAISKRVPRRYLK